MGHRHFFVLWGEGVLLTTCARGGGWVTCPGGKAYLIHSGGGLIKALMCPGGRGALTPCVSWGWGGSEEKKWAPPRIISGTALNFVR